MPRRPCPPSPPSPAPARRGLHRQRPGEAGTILVLVMLAFMVLLVVSVQLRFSASVEREQAHMAVMGTRMDLLAQAAARQAESVLLMDVEDAAADDQQGGGNPLAGGGGEGGGGGAADVVANSDSALDEWANPSALMPAMGDGLQLYVEVVDEDRKINLLSIFAEDEELRAEAREIVVRLLDVAFQGTEHDIGYGDANDLLDRLDQWAQGDRGHGLAVPLPKLKKTNAEEDAENTALDKAIFGQDEGHYPLTLGELLQVGGITPAHLDGFVEAGEYFPGLNDLLTVYSHLELKAEPEKEDAFADSPFGGSTGTSGFGTAAGEAEEEPEVTAQSTNTGLININTAPLTVLRAVARDLIPLSALELVVEFRDKLEEAEENSLLGGSSLFSDDDDSDGDQGAEDGGEGTGDGEPGEDEEDDDPSKFVFTDPATVFQKIENEFRVTVNADDPTRNDFLKWFWVESQVFTVKIMVRDPASGTRRHYRTMFWRMLGTDKSRMITLLPLETYADPRRLEDFPGDLEELSEDRMFAAR